MPEARTWRELLEHIISDSQEKQRLIDALKITPITFTRWISGESDPRPQNLRQLINELPHQYQEQMRQLVSEVRGGSLITNSPFNLKIHMIPSEFYAQVFAAHTSIAENVRFWSTSKLILQQALEQLDPERRGLSIWIVSCMPPSGPYNKVRSLRERIGVGTPPWRSNLEQDALFLGAESLAGNVVTHCRPGIIQNLEKEHNLIPASHIEHEKSVAIYPILYAGRIAGAVLVSSVEIDNFVSQDRMELIQSYANLIALAFKAEDFYMPEQIALCIMPLQTEQKIHFKRFRQIATQTLLLAAAKNQALNNQQTDILVWKQLEEELLQIPIMQHFQ
jgi:hypothetical protein